MGRAVATAVERLEGRTLFSVAAQYHFDGTAATLAAPTVDAGSLGTSDVTLAGGADALPGYGGHAWLLNGTAGEADVADRANLDPTAGLTVSAWVNAVDWNGNRRIVQKSDPAGTANNGDNQYRLTANNGQLFFGVYGVGSVQAALPSTGAWHFVAGTYDGGHLDLYVDGSMVAQVGRAEHRRPRPARSS